MYSNNCYINIFRSNSHKTGRVLELWTNFVRNHLNIQVLYSTNVLHMLSLSICWIQVFWPLLSVCFNLDLVHWLFMAYHDSEVTFKYISVMMFLISYFFQLDLIISIYIYIYYIMATFLLMVSTWLLSYFSFVIWYIDNFRTFLQ